MKRYFFYLSLLVFSIIFSSSTLADEKKNLDEYLDRTIKETSEAKVICLDGYKFATFYAAEYGGRGGSGFGGSIIQVYEYKDGKVIPAKCKPKRR